MKGKYIFVALFILAFAVVALEPAFSLAQVEDVAEEVDVEKQRELIRAAVQQGDMETAIKLADEYLKTDSVNVEVLILLADCNASIGKFTEAKEAAEKALDIVSDNVWATRTLAKINRMEAEQTESVTAKKRLFSLAQSKIEEALRLDPEDAWTNAEAALIYLGRGNKAHASELIDKSLSLQPNDGYFRDIKQRIEGESAL